MIAVSWPPSLPFPTIDLESEMVSGQSTKESNVPVYRNRRFPEHELSFSFYLNNSEFVEWRNFFDSSLYEGAAYFDATWLSILGFSAGRLINYEIKRIDDGDDPTGFWHKQWFATLNIEAYQTSVLSFLWDGTVDITALYLPSVGSTSTSVISTPPVYNGPTLMDSFSIVGIVAASAIAQWVLIYDGNGADSGEPHPIEYPECGSTVTVKNEGTLLKTGYIFGGWNTAADGSGTDYAEGSTFVINKDMTLYAKWITA
jgi:uncharacterized repeat protein (TIGR02543 family)